MERLQFIAVVAWMIGMLAITIIAMRDIVRSENEDHDRRAREDTPAAPDSSEGKS